VSRPSFYFHFPTKEHVLLELQWLEERTVASRLEHARSRRESLDELAEGLIDLEVTCLVSSDQRFLEDGLLRARC
jgi:AcrR family transcriptional regulator